MKVFGQKNSLLRKAVTWIAAMVLVLSMIPLANFARADDEVTENGGSESIQPETDQVTGAPEATTNSDDPEPDSGQSAADPANDACIDGGEHVAYAIPVKENEVDPCHDAGGYDEVTYCKNCRKEMSRNHVTIPAIAEIKVITEETEATCTTPGITTYIEKCEECGAEIFKKVTETPPAHTPVIVEEGKVPTCTEPGYESRIECSVCHKDLQYKNEIPAGHKFDVKITIKEPTCTEKGQERQYCANVGCEEYQDGDINPLGHKLKEIKKGEGTCADGAHDAYYECETCGKVFKDANGTEETTVEALKAAYHSQITVVPETKATCTKTGNNLYYKCETCGKAFKDEAATKETTVEEETIPTTPHTLTTIDGKPAKCGEQGQKEGTGCSECGKVLFAGEYIAALEHDCVTLPGVPATCTEMGLTESVYCKRCKVTLVEAVDIPATGCNWSNWVDDPHNNNHWKACTNGCGAIEFGDHNYGEWVNDIPATIYATGSMHRTCTDCNHLEKGVIPQLEKATVRVQYIDEDGKVLSTKHSLNLAKYAAYDMSAVANRIPNGYEANGEPYGDDIAGIADVNKTITVPVKKVEAETPEAPSPSPEGDDTVVAAPVAPADDEEAIADDETPLAAQDEQTIADDENPMAGNTVQLVEEEPLPTAPANLPVWIFVIGGVAVVGVSVISLSPLTSVGVRRIKK